ncbi:MAG: hypothetical protein EOP59_02905 [Sphingomonadales bacterium]|nr:MAG: hypothetical protein EOP59_02905 [Sphingomonadales bacterium]
MGELVVNKQDGRLQRKRAPRANYFGPAKRQAFLDGLAYSCNVRASAGFAGVDITTVYYHRTRDAEFARQWQEAVEVGYDRLEALVLEHGGAGQALLPPDPERARNRCEAEAVAEPLPPFDFERAIRILAQYRRRRAGEPMRPGGPPLRYATREETNASLIKLLEGVRKRMAREAGNG